MQNFVSVAARTGRGGRVTAPECAISEGANEVPAATRHLLTKRCHNRGLRKSAEEPKPRKVPMEFEIV
jgi:hypothetical protein